MGIVQHIEVFNDFLIGDVTTTKTGDLIKNGQSIAHSTICFLGNDVQRFWLTDIALLISDIL